MAHKYMQSIPLSKKYSSEGSIVLHFSDIADLTRNGYFSTTLYYRSKQPFTETDYFHGINIYADFINSDTYFTNVGFIIYTDKASYPLLASHFKHPKIILAVVHWPRFAIDKRGNMIEGTILRCIRYQANDYFRGAWIAVRDADTLFAYEINNCLLKLGPRRTMVPRANASELLENLKTMIADWEKIFLTKWINAGDQIVVSTSDNYYAKWHRHLPFSYAPKPLPQSNGKNPNNENFLTVHRQSHIEKILTYRENSSRVMFSAPLGVYAGFTNIAAIAPHDLWTICCNYLIMHYEMIVDFENTQKYVISNTYSSIGAIGKDERMILFAIMPKYLDRMYFVHLDYYGGLDIGEPIFSPQRSQNPALSFAHIETSTTTKIAPVETLLLAPRYVNQMYNLPYVFKNELSNSSDLINDGTMNTHFHNIFKSMVDQYKHFMKGVGEYGASAFEEFGKRIEQNNTVLVPSLAETAYKPIKTVLPKTYVKIRNNGAQLLMNKANTRRQEKNKSRVKKTRRFATQQAYARTPPENLNENENAL